MASESKVASCNDGSASHKLDEAAGVAEGGEMFPRQLREGIMDVVDSHAAVAGVDGVGSRRLGVADGECDMGGRMEG